MSSLSNRASAINSSAIEETQRMSATRRLSHLYNPFKASVLVALALVVGMVVPATSEAAAPAWSLQLAPGTGFIERLPFERSEAVGRDGVFKYSVSVENSGDAPTAGTYVLADTLPQMRVESVVAGPGWACPTTAQVIAGTPLSCTSGVVLAPGQSALAVSVELYALPSTPDPVANEATITGGGAATGTTANNPLPLVDRAPFAVQSFTSFTTDSAEADYAFAGGHPDKTAQRFEFPFRLERFNGVFVAVEQMKDAGVTLPTGFIGNPAAASRCEPANVRDPNSANGTSHCPPGSQVGTAAVAIAGGNESGLLHPIFNVEPDRGYPAQFAFRYANSLITLYATQSPRSDGYDLTIGSKNTTRLGVKRFSSVFWGVPAQHGSGGPEVPFLSNSGNCSDPNPSWKLAVDSWEHVGAKFSDARPNLADPNWKTASAPATPVTGCDNPALTSQFAQTGLGVKPLQGGGATQADSPTGLAVDLNFPQSNDPTDLNTNFDPEIPQSPPPKDITVTLPAGVSINPSSAGGLGACSDLASSPAGDQVHYDSVNPVSCPDASKIGSATALTPLLAIYDPVTDKVNGPQPIPGDVYLLAPHPGDLPVGGGNHAGKFRLLIQLENERYGVNIKLPGVATADPNTGQLTTVFTQNPQLPASHITVNLKEGPRAPLATPVTCGPFGSTSTIVPWSTPGTPDAHPSASFNVGSGANGSACPANAAARPFAPSMSAGTASNQAGASSPFTLHLARADGEGEISALEVTLPKGLAAKFVGVPYCSEAALAAAAAKSGVAEQRSASCPAATRIGAVTVGAGPGSNPFYTGGNAYLSGPYKGAPMSVSVITPAVAGPFDLGTVVSRNALFVDPDTAQGRVVSDPLPTILDGVPLRLRSIDVNLDRPDFTLNPTNCTPMAVNAKLTSVNGATSNPTSYFQVGNCKALKFKPGLSLALKGGTKRSDNPALTATLTAPPGQANIAQTTVLLPPSQYIDSAHVNNPCTRVQFNANACPASSILGTATAYTPLLEKPLTGPVYFRANGGERELPDMVVDLNGQIHVTLVGFIDAVTKKGSEESRVRTRFLSVPDAPVSKFVLSLKGGKKGLIENSKNLCKDKIGPATVQMIAQNGLVNNFGTKLKTSCKKGKKGKKAGRSSARVSGLALTGW